MPLDGFSLTLCEEALPPVALNWGAPQELPWMWPHQEVRYPLDLMRDANAWVWVKAWVQYGEKGKKPQGWALVGRGYSLGDAEKMRHWCVSQ